MDTRSKNMENDTLPNKGEEITKQPSGEEEKKKLPPKKGSVRYKLGAKWIKVLLFFITAFLAAFICVAFQIISSCDVVWDMSAAIAGDEQPRNKTGSYIDNTGKILTSDIEKLYAQLYIAASGAMRYGYDLGDEYIETLNNEIDGYDPDAGNIYIDIHSAPRGVRYENTEMHYYVSYGDKFSTNITGLSGGQTLASLKDKLDSLGDQYYIRFKNELTYGGTDTGRVYSQIYNDSHYTDSFEKSEPHLGLCKSYYDKDTKTHIFDASGVGSGYIYVIPEDQNLLYPVNKDGSFGEINYDGSKKYVYDSKTDRSSLKDVLDPLDDSDITIAVAVKPDKNDYAALRASDDEQLETTQFLIIGSIIAGAVLAVLIIVLTLRCGYNRDTGTFTATRLVDAKFSSEVFALFMFAALVVTEIASKNMYGNLPLTSDKSAYSSYALAAASYFALWVIGFGSFIVIVRKLKSGMLFKTSLVCMAFRYLFRRARKGCDAAAEKLDNTRFHHFTVSQKFFIRNIVFGVFTGGLILLLVLAIIENWPAEEMGILEAYLTFYAVYFIWYLLSGLDYFHDSDKLCDKLDAISEGREYDGEAMRKTSPFYTRFKGLDNLDEKIKKQADEMVKSEKTKVELVTNVSHDLKTPLTSIISYIYLLSKEDMSDEAKDYVKVLQTKSEKLKTIVNDVFSLAKAASGAEIKNERLDLAMLVNQTVASNSDITEKAGITLKTKIPDKSVYIIGDGDKLSRVFQNLYDNAMKYSLDGTRVFIDMQVHGDTAQVYFKNTSAYEMNFTAEEITERFARGDKSRTDGGSGLGLSIAKTFTEACGGAFRIELEGDMFKAVVEFKAVE